MGDDRFGHELEAPKRFGGNGKLSRASRSKAIGFIGITLSNLIDRLAILVKSDIEMSSVSECLGWRDHRVHIDHQLITSHEVRLVASGLLDVASRSCRQVKELTNVGRRRVNEEVPIDVGVRGEFDGLGVDNVITSPLLKASAAGQMVEIG